MRLVFTFLLGILSLSSVFAQLHDNIWLTNRPALDPAPIESKIDFSVGNPNISSQIGGVSELHTCGTTISDESGNLLFYTNCYQVVNSNRELMENGDSICFDFSGPSWWSRNYGSPVPQGLVVLPSISEANEYYLVYINALDFGLNSYRGTHLLFSRIDMNGDNGLGSVVDKNTVVLEDSIQPGRLSAVKHANGRDWWLVVFRRGSKQYYKVLLSPHGIEVKGMGEIDITLPPVNGPGCFSPDGTKFGVATYEKWEDPNPNPIPRVDIFDFDRCTGTLSNRKRIYYNEPGVEYGAQSLGSITFSPNSRFAYISRWTHVHQVDLEAANPQASLNKVAEYDGYRFLNAPVGFGYGQIAPDGRIYINDGAPVNNTYHFVEQPNEPRLLSKVRQRGLQLPGMHGWHIPNHPNYRLGPLEGSGCDTLGVEKAISILGHPYPYEACVGGEAHFEATAFGTGRSYQWQQSTDAGATWQNLSNGGHFSQATTEYLLLHDIPASFANYQFRCVITGNISTEASRPATLTLTSQLPNASFSYVQDKDSIHFQNLTTGAGYIEWQLGDGDSTILEAPAHLYRNAGTYPVMLIATNACGQDTLVQNIVIADLVAEFHADRTHGCAPFTINYNSDVPYRVSNLRYLTPSSSVPAAWNTPDGTHTVTYNTPGTFDATMIAFTPQSVEKDTLKKTGYITIETGINPTADISAQQTGNAVQLGSGFNFADTYTWFFSNGDTLSGQNVDYMFSASGIYQVVLETANHCGAALDTVTFVVGDPGAAFSYGSTIGCGPLTLQFQNDSPFQADSIHWMFNGGSPTSTNTEHPIVTFSASGNYSATMIAYVAGVTDTVVHQFTIELLQDECPMPQVFTQVNGLEVTVWTDCTGSPAFQWDMGDGTIFTSQGITYQYDSAGVYDISLTVTGQCGGSALATTQVSLAGPSATGWLGRPNDSFKVFPNPANSRVYFASITPVSGQVGIRLLTATGSPVTATKAAKWDGSAVLPLDGIPSGLYFYEIMVDGVGIQQGKLVVAR